MKTSSKHNLCLFGAGGHGRVLAAQIERFLHASVVFCDRSLYGQSVAGIHVLYKEAADIDSERICISIGDNSLREELHNLLLPKISPPIIINSDYNFAASIGAGSQILAGSVINTMSVIGSSVIVNTNAVVEHDCTVGDFCHIAPGALLGGGVSLGSSVFVGTGAVILPGLHVQSGTIIGAGSVVTKDILDPGIWVGSPARPHLKNSQRL
ncbi:acetyltransferase [Synechococcus sp. CC9311]|uniref:acetyltransferase n=1 Tax=Synechococcus sp. (strain CC9311) TaxID=64471 RepID=UPI0000DDA9BF|nr:acetyltransferase [Synechococcus sp. CC9311]ABI47668.1 pilin glycosylation protein PglB NMB1820 [Synechococcus sp. CC9311]